MISIENEQLRVELLDPAADRDRFGVRYCTGGYIFQVADVRKGPLLSGPTYPDSFNWFDGQGIPDSFDQSPLCDPGSDRTQTPIVGIGVCDLDRKRVKEFCAWNVEQTKDGVTMTTVQNTGSSDSNCEEPSCLPEERYALKYAFAITGRTKSSSVGFPIPSFPRRRRTTFVVSACRCVSGRIHTMSWEKTVSFVARDGRGRKVRISFSTMTQRRR